MSEFASSMAFVVPYNPLLGSSGPQGPKNVSQPWIEALSPTCRLTLVVISDDVSLCEDLLRKAFPMLHEVHVCRPVSGWRKSLKRLMCMVRMLPPAIVEGDSPEFKALLPQLKNQCEMFHLEYFTLAQSIALIKPDRPVFLHGHDAYSLFQRRLMRDAETPKEWLLSLVRWMMFLRLENAMFSCASEVFTVSPIDQRYLIGHGVFRAKYLPPPMLAKEISVPISRASMVPELLCLVAATYQASQHAILERVVSALANSSDGALGERPKLTLLGRSAEELKQALGDTLPIDAVSYADDYEGFLSGKNWICFYPQRVGAGLHTKIRDVMLAKVPVVGFAEIMEAFDGCSGADYVSCQSEHQAVKALQDLFLSASLRVEMGKAGAKLLKARFGRSRVQQCYQNIIRLASPPMPRERERAGMEADLRALQAAQLNVAIQVIDVCNRHNIPYFLIAGTLLGAVRHQGCIPWDDDLDIGMLRKDFDRFIQVAQSELGADLFVQTLATDPHMPFPFAKIRLAETLVRESASRHCKWQSGVFIDIFPLDGVPDGFFAKTRQKIELRILSILLLAKCNFTLAGVDASFWKYLLFRGAIQPLSKCFPRLVLVRMLEGVTRRYSSFETDMVMAAGGSYGYHKEMVERAWFEHRVQKPFGVHEFSCPAGWQSYLTKFYGDYMTPPPEGQRFNRHGILNVVLRDWQ